MRQSITDPKANLEFNKSRWGDADAWTGKDNYGYAWGGQNQQGMSEASSVADKHLRPFLTEGRYDYKILELSPGGGRFTHELIRYAGQFDYLDMNQACLDICKERFKYVPVPQRFYVNDGQSCDMIEDSDYELIASFASMVHAHPEIIRGYTAQLAKRLRPGGVLWIDHSGKGADERGHRTDMNPERMAGYASEAGLTVLDSRFRSSRDCITVMQRPAA